jgi:hypothetical protein
MKSIIIQLANNNQPVKEQYVNPESENFFKRIFAPIDILDGHIIIRVQAGPGVENGVEELMRRLSPITLKYDWRDCIDIKALYAELSPRHMRMLLLLADYSTEQAAELTGYSEGYVKQLRFEIYERIDVEGNKRNRSRKALKEFCKGLMSAGVSLIVWTPEMKEE